MDNSTDVEEIIAIVHSAVVEVARQAPQYRTWDQTKWRVEAAGGYRRGKTSFHDADFLVTHPQLGLKLLQHSAVRGCEV